MNENILDKAIVLKLNKSWSPVGQSDVRTAIIDLCAGSSCYALDIDYEIENGKPNFSKPLGMTPKTWDEWIHLPIRPWDLVLRSPSLTVRVPTVLVAKNFNKMPIQRPRRYPSWRHIWHRDKGVDQYSGKKLAQSEASIDHVVPVSRGGGNEWTNVVLTKKETNWKKGNKMNDEIGLKLIRQPFTPPAVPVASLITEPKHEDWKHFLFSASE